MTDYIPLPNMPGRKAPAQAVNNPAAQRPADPALMAGPPPASRRGAEAATAKPARRRSPFRFLGRAVGVVAGLGVAASVVGGIYALHTYNKYAADLPNLDSLAHYQPKVMSRVYAGDSRLIAELATERRIYVPISAIPDMVKQAFLSASVRSVPAPSRSRSPRTCC